MFENLGAVDNALSYTGDDLAEPLFLLLPTQGRDVLEKLRRFACILS